MLLPTIFSKIKFGRLGVIGQIDEKYQITNVSQIVNDRMTTKMLICILPNSRQDFVSLCLIIGDKAAETIYLIVLK